jgi:hypothetical protein
MINSFNETVWTNGLAASDAENLGISTHKTLAYWIAYRGMTCARGDTLAEAVNNCVAKLQEGGEANGGN